MSGMDEDTGSRKETPSGADKVAGLELGLLDRPVLPEYREQWARHYARPASTMGVAEDEGGEGRIVVLFRIGAEWLALPAGLFEEIVEPHRYHSLPHRRDSLVLGIVNLRGELVVCVSLAVLLGIEAETVREAGEPARAIFARMVVLDHEGRRVVFPVDEVHGLHRFTGTDLRPPPATVGRAASAFTRGLIAWGECSAGLLDEKSLLDALDRGLA